MASHTCQARGVRDKMARPFQQDPSLPSVYLGCIRQGATALDRAWVVGIRRLLPRGHRGKSQTTCPMGGKVGNPDATIAHGGAVHFQRLFPQDEKAQERTTAG
jgi:hypothetical protein